MRTAPQQATSGVCFDRLWYSPLQIGYWRANAKYTCKAAQSIYSRSSAHSAQPIITTQRTMTKPKFSSDVGVRLLKTTGPRCLQAPLVAGLPCSTQHSAPACLSASSGTTAHRADLT